MNWKRGTFKGKQVWVAVDDGGAAVVQGGRTPIRYSKKADARVYRAGSARVEVDPDGPVEALDAGVSADTVTRPKVIAFGSAGTRTEGQAAHARKHARQRLDALPDDAVQVFTDGACRGNPGPAGAGALAVLPDGRRGEASLSLGHATNNVGELTAIGVGLDLLDEAGVAPDAPVALFTDSRYAIGVLTQGWKAKANRELIGALRGRLEARPGVDVHWVAGHVGIDDNERADTLANLGADGVTRVEWSER